MEKKLALTFSLLLSSGAACLQAADAKPVYKWVSANEYYFILPAAQDLYLPRNGDTLSVKPWGFGLTFDIYYRLTDIDLNNVGGGAGTLKPALGFKMGYIFEGFWTTKEK